MFDLGKITGQHLNMSISKLIQNALDTEASQVLLISLYNILPQSVESN